MGFAGLGPKSEAANCSQPWEKAQCSLCEGEHLEGAGATNYRPTYSNEQTHAKPIVDMPYIVSGVPAHSVDHYVHPISTIGV